VNKKETITGEQYRALIGSDPVPPSERLVAETEGSVVVISDDEGSIRAAIPRKVYEELNGKART